MIPKIIWQTYKTKFNELPNHILNLTNSWIEKNPEYEYRYFDDDMIEEFILLEYGKDWHKIFLNCKIPVMKSDLWRYLVINKYGGVYVDIDTECLKPLHTWVNDKYDFIVCDDGGQYEFAQLAFAAQSNTKIMNNVLNNVKNAIQNTKIINNQYINKTTGVHIWTKSILEVIGVKEIIDPAINSDKINNSLGAIKHKFYCYSDTEVDKDEFGMVKFFNGGIYHFTASQNWNFEGYLSWQKQLKELINE